MTGPGSRPAAPRVHTLARWIGGIALVAAAWGVTVLTPGSLFVQQPFPVSATVDQPADGRKFRVTVREVRGAAQVSHARGWAAEGNWLLVTFDAQALRDEEGAYLGRVQLRVAGRTYAPSERPGGASNPVGQLPLELPIRSTAAFELPDDVLDQPAVVEFGLDSSDECLDSVIRHDVDLTGVAFEGSAEIRDRGWAP